MVLKPSARLVLILLLTLPQLTACATSSPAPVGPEFCEIAEPITLFDMEWAALSDESAALIHRHNLAGETLCQW